MIQSSSSPQSHRDAPRGTTTEGSPSPHVLQVERGYPLIGTLVDVLRDGPGFMSRIARKHPGEVVGFRLGPITCYLVTSPDHVQHVLQDHSRDFSKGGMWEAVRKLAGYGLATSEGELWLRQRRMMQPLFSSSRLATLAETMIDVIDQELDSLASRASGKVIDMEAEMMAATQDVLLETLFGSGMDRRAADSLLAQLQIAFREMNLRLFLYFLPRGVPLPGDRLFRQSVSAIDEAMMTLVRERRASGRQHNDLLSLLLQARDDVDNKGMTDRQLRDELVTLFAAGYETTAVGMTWLWYLLDRNPDVDRKLRAEVATVLGGRKPTYEDLARLPYARLAFLESLRMYPSVWMFPRFAAEDTVVGGYPIPAGSPMLLSPWVSHRNPDAWTEPETFDPERFTPERSAGRPRYAFYPFGGGPRKCIGEGFSVMEGQLLTVMMVQRFRPQLVPGTKVVPKSIPTLRPRFGLKMRLNAA